MKYLQAMPVERPRNIKALEILRRMARDGYIIVVDDELDIEVVRNRDTRGFGIVAFLL